MNANSYEVRTRGEHLVRSSRLQTDTRTLRGAAREAEGSAKKGVGSSRMGCRTRDGGVGRRTGGRKTVNRSQGRGRRGAVRSERGERGKLERRGREKDDAGAEKEGGKERKRER